MSQQNKAYCPRCDGMKIVDPAFLEETKGACANFMVELIKFAKKHKIDYTEMPILTELATVIREIENL